MTSNPKLPYDIINYIYEFLPIYMLDYYQPTLESKKTFDLCICQMKDRVKNFKFYIKKPNYSSMYLKYVHLFLLRESRDKHYLNNPNSKILFIIKNFKKKNKING